MTPALLWLIAGVALIVSETLSGEFVLVMIGLAALGAAGVSALGMPIWLDVAVFAILAVGLVVLARPALKRRMLSGTSEVKTNVDALPGRKAVVESTVDANGGRVSIDGEEWSARCLDETQVLEKGQTVMVVEISGATAIVWAEP